MIKEDAHITVKNLTMAYDSFVVMRDLNFTIKRGDIFLIIGGSGCGKSTLMKIMVGLKEPAKGEVLYEGVSFWKADPSEQQRLMKRFGILYQSSALWSFMTLAENVALPLEQYTDLTSSQIKEVVSLKLSLVGLGGFDEFYPSEISGGMRKRAGLARAMALDPDILFFDDQVLRTTQLQLPHPQLHKRRFVLQPLCDIASELVHPVLRQTIRSVLSSLKDDKKKVILFE